MRIIVPNFHHGAFLGERLRSILDQPFQDVAFIVPDDASSNDSLAVIRERLRSHPHRLVCNPANSGQPCSQWLRGMDMAEGHYIWIAESDDTCAALFLERMVSHLESASVLAYCRTTAIDAGGVVFRKPDPALHRRLAVLESLPDSDRWDRGLRRRGPLRLPLPRPGHPQHRQPRPPAEAGTGFSTNTSGATGHRWPRSC